MARGIIFSKMNEKKIRNDGSRRQRLTNTPSHDTLRTKLRKQGLWRKKKGNKKDWFNLKVNSTWSRLDLFSCSFPPPPFFLLISLFTTSLLRQVTTKYRLWWLVMVVVFRNICGGRWMVRTRRTLVSRSTSVGRWTTRPRWNHRSRQSIYALAGRWSWSSWWMGPMQWSPSAYGQRYPGTWWFRRTRQCWRTSPYGCRHRTSWSSCR